MAKRAISEHVDTMWFQQRCVAHGLSNSELNLMAEIINSSTTAEEAIARFGAFGAKRADLETDLNSSLPIALRPKPANHEKVEMRHGPTGYQSSFSRPAHLPTGIL